MLVVLVQASLTRGLPRYLSTRHGINMVLADHFRSGATVHDGFVIIEVFIGATFNTDLESAVDCKNGTRCRFSKARIECTKLTGRKKDLVHMYYA